MLRHLFRSCLVVLWTCSAAAAQEASYEFPASLAPGCLDAARNERVAFALLSPPKLGGSLQLTVPSSDTNPGCKPWNAAFLVTGRRLPAPVDVTHLGFCGLLRVTPDVLVATPAGPFATSVLMALRVPNDAALLGAEFYQQVFDLQWFCVVFGGGLLSRGGRGVIGW